MGIGIDYGKWSEMHPAPGISKSLSDKEQYPQECDCCPEPASNCLPESEPVNKVQIDFRTKKIHFQNKYLSPREAIQLEIMHLNPYLYKVTINATDSTVMSPISENGLSYFLKPANITSLVSNLMNTVGTVSNVTYNSATNSALNIPTAIAKNSAKWWIAQLRGEGVPPAFVKGQEPTEIARLQQGVIGALDADVREVNMQIENTNRTLMAFKRRLAILRESDPDCSRLQTNNIDVEDYYSLTRQTFVELENDIRQQARAYIIAISAFQDYLNKNKYKVAWVSDSLIKTGFGSLLKTITDNETAIGVDRQEEFLRRLDQLKSVSFCYRSLPIFFGSDVKKIKVDIIPRKEDSTFLHAYSTEFSLPWTSQFIYGVGAGFQIDGLYDESTVLVRDSNKDNSKISYHIQTTDGARIGLGINAQGYYGVRISSSYQPIYLALTFGAGLSLASKPKPRLNIGAAFVFGQKRRLVIGGGLTGGYVSRLAEPYRNVSFASEPTSYVWDVLQTSWQLSLSYSILGNQ